MKRIQNQFGFLTMITVVLIIIIGFLAIAMAYIIYGGAFSATYFQFASKALYVAESGLEDATHELLTSPISNRYTCSSINTGNANSPITGTVDDGTYNVISTGPFFNTAPTTVNAASPATEITATVTTIPVVSTSGYQSAGGIRIDREFITYTDKDGTNFKGVTRGVDGTTAAKHSNGTRIAQAQCNLSSQGGVPSLTLPANTFGGKRKLKGDVQLQEGWAVGANLASPNRLNLNHWNTPTEKTWTSQPSTLGTLDLNSVSMLSNVDVWAVGMNGTAVHYNGSSWTSVPLGNGDDLYGVSAVTGAQAFGCVDQGKVYRWNGGSSWVSSTLPNAVKFRGISMLDTLGNGYATTGWVVGNKNSAFLYTGTSATAGSWALTASGIGQPLTGVSMVTANDAFTAGNGGKIYRWTGGSTWATMTTPGTSNLNAISMINTGTTSIGWAVGAASAAWYYPGTGVSWSSKNTGIIGSVNLTGVVTVSENEAWAVADNGNIYQWSGTSTPPTWTLITTAAAGLLEIDMIHPSTQPLTNWSEDFG